MLRSAKKVGEQLMSFIKKNFPESRVICLLLYGSSLNESGITPKDYDFLLLLDKYHERDYSILKKAKKDLPMAELFVDYWDQINRRGFENYQRGRHGSYFVSCLAASKCLLGKNVYLLNLNKIPKSSVRKDLLYRVEEYFYRIQKHYINDLFVSEDTVQMIKKYISRICMDLLLYSEELSFNDAQKYHYMDIINLCAKRAKIFPHRLKIVLQKFFTQDGSIKLVPLIISQLYNIYFRCFEENRNRSPLLNISRGSYKNIIFEYSLIDKKNKPITVILLDGLPSVPQKRELISELNNKGYDVFFPRYEGTWESIGEFLERSPVFIIDEFIQQLNTGIALNDKEVNKRYKSQDIFVLGSSFGGGVALSLSDNDCVKKICAISPVISFKKVNGIETLEGYISNFYTGAYRFKTKNWKLMIDDRLFCPLNKTSISSKKILIIGGESDNQIPIIDLLSYCKGREIELKTIDEDEGHITFSKIGPFVLNLLDKFFKS